MSVDRSAVRKRIDEVRAVLLADWDPLQVASNRMLSDEYDAYLAKVMRAIDTGEIERIVDVLIEIEGDLGVGPVEDRNALQPAARRLLNLRRQ